MIQTNFFSKLISTATLLAFFLLLSSSFVVQAAGYEDRYTTYQTESVQLAQADTNLSEELVSPTPVVQDSAQVLGTSELVIPPKGFATDLLAYVNSILTIVIVAALALVLFAFVMAGFSWITAGGDKGKTDEARSRMVNAIIGILIVSASFAMLRFVGYFLGFEDFAEVISSIIPIS